MQTLSDAVSSLVFDIIATLAVPTVLMLLVRRFVPVLGNELWRYYCQALVWLVRLPFRLVRLLVHEVTAARRRT